MSYRSSKMFGGSLVLALAIFGFAGWLHYYESTGWPEEDTPQRNATDLDHRYRKRRARSRTRIHAMLIGCGVLITIAAFMGPGRVWIGCWMTVALVLMSIIALALGDAYRTHRYYQDKIQQNKSKV